MTFLAHFRRVFLCSVATAITTHKYKSRREFPGTIITTAHSVINERCRIDCDKRRLAGEKNTHERCTRTCFFVVIE